MLKLAAAQATELRALIEQQRLYKQIGPKKHVLVDGWLPIIQGNRKRPAGQGAGIAALAKQVAPQA